MNNYKYPSLALPLLTVGCIGHLSGEHWVGSESKYCALDASGGSSGYFDCQIFDLPEIYRSDELYDYGQYFLDIEDDYAIFSYMSVFTDGEYHNEVFCSSQLLNY